MSMGFSRQEYWSGLPCPAPGDLSHPGIEPVSLMSPALAGEFSTTSTTRHTGVKWTQFYVTDVLKKGKFGHQQKQRWE